MSFDVKNTPKDWVCTDPDNYQFRKNNEDGSFTFKEINTETLGDSIFRLPEAFLLIWERFPILWKQATIFITDYSRREIHEMLLTYYSEQQITDVANIDNPEHHALIAECIFELEMCEYE